jgi:hypothetical protein
MKECVIYNNIAIPANDKAPGIRKPRECPLNLISALVTPQFTAVMISLFLIVIPVGADQFNASISQTPAERVTIIAFVGNQPLGILPRTAATFACYSDGFKRFLKERGLVRGRRVHVVPQRNSLAVNHHHPLRAFPPLGFPDAGAPFLAGAKLPSMNDSLQSSCSFSSSSERNALHAVTHTSCSSHSFNLRQQVEGLGYSLGRSCQGAPVRNIQRMPSKTLRLSAQGLPPFRFTLGFGKSFSSLLHCSSVSSSRFFRFFSAIEEILLSMTKFTNPARKPRAFKLGDEWPPVAKPASEACFSWRSEGSYGIIWSWPDIGRALIQGTGFSST